MIKPAKLYYKTCTTNPEHIFAKAALTILRSLGLLKNFKIPLDSLTLPHDLTRGLMQLWQKMHWSSGDGMMPPEQLLSVYRLAVTWPGEGDIVELGCWTGLTTCHLGTACKVRGQGMVYAVDTFEGTKEGGKLYESISNYNGSTKEVFDSRICNAELRNHVEALAGYTSEMVHHYKGTPIRLLFIDADHSYEGVKQDFELWSPLVEPGGLVLFHDYDMEGVARFINQDMTGKDGFSRHYQYVGPNLAAFRKSPATVTAKDSFEASEDRQLIGV